MKLGNISQTIVPIPKFYFDKETRTVDLFKSNTTDKKSGKQFLNKRNKSYFRSKDLFTSNCDLNVNNNPRTYSHKFQMSNEQKYIPMYDRFTFLNNAEKKNTYFPGIIDTYKVRKIEAPSNKNEYHNARKFLKMTDLNNFLKKDLRKEIIDNTKNLLDRINVTFDMSRWNDFDTRVTMNKVLQQAYSPITDVIQNTVDSKQDFIKTLSEKSSSLKTISDKAKKNIENNMMQKYFHLNKTVNQITRNKSDLDSLLNKSRTDLLQLKNNNLEPPQYSKEDQKFIEENKIITKRINNSSLYKDFPSKTRMEFQFQKVFPIKRPFSINDDWGAINIEKYKCKKEIFSFLDPMWTRPLHKDAFKLIK